MRDRIDLVVLEEQRKAGGLSLAVTVSLLLHSLLVVWAIRSYHPAARAGANAPMARYVDLIKQNPQFNEAPGPKGDKTPTRAPLSDATRKAAMPEPTGPQPTSRPGDGRRMYTPPGSPQQQAMQQQQARPSMQQQAERPSALEQGEEPQPRPDGLVYEQPTRQSGGSVDWKNAIREVGRAQAKNGAAFDPGALGGGDQGSADAGQLSFETSWYNWGEYAQSMVSRIRVNWYANMPEIIRTGIRGAVTIRFTIHRDGQITDIEILKSSGTPPYDFAARKAIELSSPLNALPKDFPKASERVTCIFFYNMEIPRDR